MPDELTADSFAEPVGLLLEGKAIDATATLASILATMFKGPLAGAIAKGAVQSIARIFINTATKRFLDAGVALDSERDRHRAVASYLADEVAPWFRSLFDLLEESSDRDDEQFVQLVRIIDKRVASSEGQAELLSMVRELVESARASAQELAPLERTISFDGPGHVPAKPVPNFNAVDELERLQVLLGGSETAVCVVAQGMGGLGKTVLAQHYVACRARDHFVDGAVWIDADNFARDVLYAARCYGWKEDREPTPDEANQYLSRVLHPKKALIVVDNVDPTKVDMHALPFPGGFSRTLLTSRHANLARQLALGLNVESVQLELSLWSLPNCRSYLRKVAPEFERETDDSLDALSEFVGRLPLALRLIAAQPMHERGISAGQLLQELEAEPIHTLERFVATSGGLTRGVVQTFASSLRRLDANEWLILQILSICATGTRAEIVAEIAGLDIKATSRALNGLVNVSLAQYVSEAAAPWGVHDVIRVLTHERSKEQVELIRLEAAHQRWVEAYVERHADPMFFTELEDGLEEGIVCVGRLLDEGRVREASALCLPFCDHLRRRGKYPRALELAWRFVDTDDEAIRAPWFGNLGLFYRALGDIPKAIELHESALAINKKLNVPEGMASDLGQLGVCYQELGDIGLAIESLELALEICEEFGYRQELAVHLGNLGNCYHLQQNIPKAISLFERARSLNRELGRLQGQASALDNLGLCYQSQGDIPKAIQHHECARKLGSKIGSVEQEAISVANLALCYQQLNELAKALELHDRALTLNKRLGRLDGEAIALGNIGNCYAAQNDVPEAIELLEHALSVFTKIGIREGQANQLGNLGSLYARQGRTADARAALQRALDIFKEMGLEDSHPSILLARRKLREF